MFRPFFFSDLSRFTRELTRNAAVRREREAKKAEEARMDEKQLQLDLTTLAGFREAGRVLSAANKSLVEQIRDNAKKLSHHPTAQQIESLCEELLKAGVLEESIKHEGSKWTVYSQDGKLLGSYDTEDAAKERLGQIERFKKMKESEQLLEANVLPKVMKMMAAGDSDEDMLKMMTGEGEMDEDAAKTMLTKMKAQRAKTIKEAATLSFEDIRERVRDTIREKYQKPTPDGREVYINMHACFADKAVFSYGWEGPRWQVDYTLDDRGKVTLGEAIEVMRVETYEPITESLGIQIIEAAGKKDGKEWDVILIQTGTSANGRHYPADTLKKAAPLFEGVASFADHATDAERVARPERSVKDKVGKFISPQYGTHSVRGKMVEGIKARFKVVSGWLKEALLEAHAANEPDFYGFSIDAEGRVAKKQHNGRMVDWVEAITRVHSVDVVTTAAAGGEIVRLVASKQPSNTGGIDMTPEELKALLEATIGPLRAEITALKEVAPATTEPDEATKALMAKLEESQKKLEEASRIRENESRIDKALAGVALSEIGAKRVREAWIETAKRRDVTDEELTASIKEAVDYEAALVQPNHNPRGLGRTVKMGDATSDKFRKALEGMFEGADVDGIPQFRSIKESYCRWSGADPFDVTAQEIHRAFIAGRYDSAVDHSRIKESLTTSTWADVFGDVMYVKMLKEYRASNYSVWRRICSDIVSVSDFRTQHWVRVGGYSDLSSVAEQGTYPQLTSPGDEEIEFAVGKYGGLDDVTFEAIVNDRIGAIRRIPTSMARAAARTLYKFVFNLVTTDNPTMDYDSTALYTSHSNSGTTALTLGGLNTAIIAMRDQTAYGESSEILGMRNYPKFMIVPNELEQRAQRIVNPSDAYGALILDSDAASANDGTGIDPQAFKGKGIEVIVYDQLTDANDWFLIANPAEVNTVVMGFLNGQQEPELFVQDQPTVGSTFTADKISYKIRHIYGGDCCDHRSFYRNVVS